ncbi:DUF1176 domain-containing protein [Pseudomonas rubra]|uniref:DUF1176 domain-containing protein n=1 Tax=Pseudomonas rubra TaxID=2942627 RepID=A0ABT5PBC7_9PSED|nr:DUF1176 domain-containing protein [Pseudomonas rubra]MDD1015471.1 DUF1176 domain-containing protein [Pseudomonas rubra]MDD1041285.1 DUF1176 domain-containing protein [Pseudomonas rubra]MDD1153628.1 DUF1176 domain-containing protein [Pseudomonas rubra]
MFSARWNWLALSLLPTLTLAAAAEQVPLSRVFQDWRVACDNTRRCTAVSGSTDNPGMGLYIVREAGLKGSTRVSAISYDDISLRYEFHLDGHPTEPWKYGSTAREYYYLEGDAAVEKLRELSIGDTLSSNSNHGERRVSLQGLSATLLLMDSVQGRIGHPSAFVRPGFQPDSRLPTAPATPRLPRFTLAPTLSDAEQQAIGDDMIAQTKDELSASPHQNWKAQAEVYPLDPAHALVRLRYGCAEDGCNHSLYRVSRSAPYQATPLELKADPKAHFSPDLYGQISFNPVSGQLKIYREMGKDCGESSIWQYDGAAMQLKDRRTMWRCDSINEEYWPVLWRAKG